MAANISGVDGKRSASNPGALKFEIRVPAAALADIKDMRLEDA